MSNMGTEDMRFINLDAKVDKMVDIFQQVMINQGLMQQELKMMNVTLSKVDLLNTQLIQCSSTCALRIQQLEKETGIYLEASHEKERAFFGMFRVRDKVLVSLVSSTALLVIALVLQHVFNK